MIYGAFKPLPDGVSYSGTKYSVEESAVKFLPDHTYLDKNGQSQIEQTIFNEIFSLINEAESYILVDMFLWNSMLGTATTSYRELSNELVVALVNKKKSKPDITIQVITDPINSVYGGIRHTEAEQMRQAGITVSVTDLTALRDSNPLYSGLWRVGLQWFGNSVEGGWLPNPFALNAPPLTLRSYLIMLNFKANHRKLLVADAVVDGEQKLVTIISSANPHDGSSAHTNVALRVDSWLWRDVVSTESSVADFSGWELLAPNQKLIDSLSEPAGDITVQLITESVIRQTLLDEMSKLTAGDKIDIAMFYLSDRRIIKAIKRADARGVDIRLLLDPNKDAFGREKNGIPNRPVAHELLGDTENLEIRWCNTHGEQCHMKFVILSSGDQQTLISGSANYTRRNLGDYNLETNLLVQGNRRASVFVDAEKMFYRLWQQPDGAQYSLPYESYQDDSLWNWWRYYIMEVTGLSTF